MIRYQRERTQLSIAGWLLLIVMLSGCGSTAAQLYRLPYEDGTVVEITADAETHANPEKAMYDTRAVDSPGLIVAAADGWIRHIEDGHAGAGTGPNNFVWIEHPYPYCQNPDDRERADWPDKLTSYDSECEPCEEDYCNEHSGQPSPASSVLEQFQTYTAVSCT